MKRLFTFCLLAAMVTSLAYAATPTKPYADLVDGDALTATWLMGTFNTIYNWAQGTNASVTSLMGGTTFGSPLTASFTTTVSSPTQYLIWDATALNYVAAGGSGTMYFKAEITAVATPSQDCATFILEGSLRNNASGTNFIESPVKWSWREAGYAQRFDASATYAVPGRLLIFASSPANVAWKCRLNNYASW